MTNIEHLLENAICAHENGQTLEEYRNSPANRMMLADTGADEELIWAMAYYVTTTYREQPRWIPVTERLPEDDEMVLAVVDAKTDMITFVGAVEPAVWRPEEGWILEAFPEAQVERVTHWMPIPEAPEVE